MKTAHDLFLSEETGDQKARRSVAEIIADDENDHRRLAELAKPTIFYKKLSRLKSTCAWFMLHKRITATAIGVTILGIVGASFIQHATTEDFAITDGPVVITPQTEVRVDAKPVPADKPTEVSTPEAATNKLGTKSLQDALVELNSPLTPPDEPDDHSKDDDVDIALPATPGELKSPTLPALTPTTDLQVREPSAEADPKIDVEKPSDVTSRAAPVELKVAQDTAGVPEEAPSASDFIDQFGFGTEPKAAPTDKIDAGAKAIESEKPSEDVIPIPAAKPQLDKPAAIEEIKDVRYRIVDRDKEAAGFRRMKDNNPATLQWFLVVEAVDAKGKAIPTPVMSMDSGEVKVVTKWAIQVPEKDFMKFSDEKKKTGKIANTVIGTAPSNQTEPKWTVKVTGNMLTEWE